MQLLQDGAGLTNHSQVNLIYVSKAAREGDVSEYQRHNQRSPRVQTSLTATLIDSDGGELAVEVIDLSSGGFRLRTNEMLVAGEEVRLRVERYGDFRAQVQWANGHEAGGRFLEPATL